MTCIHGQSDRRCDLKQVVPAAMERPTSRAPQSECVNANTQVAGATYGGRSDAPAVPLDCGTRFAAGPADGHADACGRYTNDKYLGLVRLRRIGGIPSPQAGSTSRHERATRGQRHSSRHRGCRTRAWDRRTADRDHAQRLGVRQRIHQDAVGPGTGKVSLDPPRRLLAWRCTARVPSRLRKGGGGESGSRGVGSYLLRWTTLRRRPLGRHRGRERCEGAEFRPSNSIRLLKNLGCRPEVLIP